MAVPNDGEPTARSARSIAYINYALLLAAIFFAGVPAIAAAVIAYSRRDEAAEPIGSHYDFQIRIFWVAFTLAMCAAASFVGAMIKIASDMFEITRLEGWGAPDVIQVDFSHVTVDTPLAALLGLTALFAAIGGLWLIFAPTLGLIKLASGRGMGHSAGS
jgi:uncharacterized membrane protein